MTKNRGLLIIGWFALLIAWNIATHWTENTGNNGLYIFLQALGYLTTPIELLLSAAVISGIVFSKRKPMGDR
jgi:hypothetical protein